MVIKMLSQQEIPVLVKLMHEVLPNIEYYPKPVLMEFLKMYTPKFFKELPKQKDSIILISKEKDEITGFAFGWDDYGVYWLDWLGVKKEHRHKGIATELLNAFEKECKKRGCHKIHMDTSKINLPAISCYIKNGYFIEGELKKHWLKWDYVLLSKFI